MTPEALAAREVEDAALAAALSAARGLAQAWWEQVAREACEAGRFSFAAWTREMRRRFGEAGAGADSTAGGPSAGRAGAGRPGAARRRTRYILPCNGMEKLNPDGTCGCGARHDEAYWRARHEAWRAESPENVEHPTWDELRNQGGGDADDCDADDCDADDFDDGYEDEETRDDGQP